MLATALLRALIKKNLNKKSYGEKLKVFKTVFDYIFHNVGSWSVVKQLPTHKEIVLKVAQKKCKNIFSTPEMKIEITVVSALFPAYSFNQYAFSHKLSPFWIQTSFHHVQQNQMHFYFIAVCSILKFFQINSIARFVVHISWNRHTIHVAFKIFIVGNFTITKFFDMEGRKRWIILRKIAFAST